MLWSLPSTLQHLPSYGEPAGWLEVLGPRGPCLVEQILGMEEFPHGMNCDGKVSMLESSVRHACVAECGEVDRSCISMCGSRHGFGAATVVV